MSGRLEAITSATSAAKWIRADDPLSALSSRAVPTLPETLPEAAAAAALHTHN
jgi:hypothetical protein